MIKQVITITYKMGRRIVVAVIGSTLLAVGVVMLVAPGPATLVIPVGLAILGLEFAFARRWLAKLRRAISDQSARIRARKT